MLLLLPWPTLFSEHYWWAFILATAAILVALRLLHKEQWLQIAGLNMSPKHLVWSIVAFGLMVLVAILILPAVYTSTGLRAESPAFGYRIGLLFQSLNEEILFRALLIGLLIRYIKSPLGKPRGCTDVHYTTRY